jgi:hypothetical protein
MAADLLVACPKCHAWPMVASGQPRWLIFRCARCGHQATARGTPAAGDWMVCDPLDVNEVLSLAPPSAPPKNRRRSAAYAAYDFVVS